eukprot:m.97297 g.97297  ORF g.97297 m.97297 type:complete len:350 (+) comp13972_c0_seq6:101-1150(+)
MDLAENVDVASYSRPTFFELVAEEGMIESLRPALRYLLTVGTQHAPHTFQPFLRFSDEIHAALQLLIDGYYLRTYDASFSEEFYGLKRVARTRSGVLRLHHRLRSLLFVVLLPYLASRRDKILAALKKHLAHRPAVLRATLAALRAAALLWRITSFAFKILYLLGATETFSPAWLVCGITMQRVTDDDLEAEAENERVIGEQRKIDYKAMAFPRRALNQSLDAVADLLRSALPASVFFLTFLEWWYSTEHLRPAPRMPVPPYPAPPALGLAAALARPVPGSLPPSAAAVVPAGQCGVCKTPFRNPALLATSGYVFCYSCIHDVVSETGQCPLTHLPSSVSHLIRLYHES